MDQHPTMALAPLAGGVAIADDALPMPIFSGAQMAAAVAAYRDVQRALDASMPDQIMTLDGKAFRKKGYWRALRVAFNLDVKIVEERREVDGVFDDGRDNFGYLIICKATAANGRAMEGDGACFAAEKAGKFRCPHPDPQQPSNRKRSAHWPAERCPDFDPAYQWRALPAGATAHNIRSHAVTRAMNRAISNLVGFGEVSAEEVIRHDDASDDEPPARSSSARPVDGKPGVSVASRSTSVYGGVAGVAGVVSQAQLKRMYAIAKGAGWSEAEIKARVLRHGFEHSADITRDKYELLCAEFEAGDDGGAS
jgi:hypothetical protein